MIWLRYRQLACAGCAVEGCALRESADAAAACPVGRWGRFLGAMTAEAQAEPLRTVAALAGPALWEELHSAPVAVYWREWERWLAAFALRIPCGDCRREWEALCRDMPPVLDSPRSFLLWTFEAHNRVNVRLGKPSMSLQEALKRWGW